VSWPRDPRDGSGEPWPEHDLGGQRGDPFDDPRDEAFGRPRDDPFDEPREQAFNQPQEEALAPPPPQAAAAPDDSEAADAEWDTRHHGDRRRPTTAEQAVPWLVGAVLALAGIVIVLVALIFTDANGGFASASGLPTLGLPSASTLAGQSPTGTPRPSPTPSVKPTPAPTRAPTYGALEMLYLSRPNAFAPSQLFRNDFSKSAPATVVARASLDITHYAAAQEGTVSVAIVNGKLLGLAKGKPNRVLANLADAATFGPDATTVFAVKITRGGTNDDATVTSITFASGATKKLSTINFRHPAPPQLTALGSARFLDDGGMYRIYATSDGNLVLWIANAGQWRIDPVNGSVVAAARQPMLWSPDGSHRINVTENGLVTTLTEVDQSGKTISRSSFTGLLSHLRWSPRGNRVAFTLGTNLADGGVRQDLYLWDLVNGRIPSALTTNGSSFGAEWLGSAQFWLP
jgi:hypothetical protein